MAFFEDKKAKEKISQLENDREKMWEKLKQLEKDNKALTQLVQKKTSDYEKEASTHSRKAAEFRNKAEQRLGEADEFVQKIISKLGSATNEVEDISKLKQSTLSLHGEVTEAKDRVLETEAELLENVQLLENKIEAFNSFFEEYPDLETQLQQVEGNILAIGENVGKSSASVQQINKRKQDIDDLYREVFGYSEANDEGEDIKIEGLKDELETAYTNLDQKIEAAFETIKSLSENSHQSYAEFEKKHKEKYSEINKEIESLLPAAMTAGLSSAFSNKKDDEVKSAESLQRKFAYGIYFLVGVSLLPFFVSVYFLYNEVPLDEVINRLPRMVLAIVPMYIPVLWFTYSANKKLNLSKRLIEEYAHKEVLSKTYEGLSKQITGLTNDEQSLELKYRLLSNFLQVSSENPGKLISNYEASDHPVMEALEQSYKFQIALDKLEHIPGLNKVAAILENRARKKIDKKTGIIEEALSKDSSSEGDKEPEA